MTDKNVSIMNIGSMTRLPVHGLFLDNLAVHGNIGALAVRGCHSVARALDAHGQNAFQITFGDSILPRMSRDFAIFIAKHLAGYYL